MNTGQRLVLASGLHGVSAAAHLKAWSNLTGNASLLLVTASKFSAQSALFLLNRPVTNKPTLQYPIEGLTEKMLLAMLRQLTPLQNLAQTWPVAGSFQLFSLSGRNQTSVLGGKIQSYPQSSQSAIFALASGKQIYPLAGTQQKYK